MLAPVCFFSQRGQKVSRRRVWQRELQQGFCGIAAEEFFASFHADVDQLDGGFDVATGQGQSLLSVLGIVHAVSMVGEVGDGALDRIEGSFRCGVLWRRCVRRRTGAPR